MDKLTIPAIHLTPLHDMTIKQLRSEIDAMQIERHARLPESPALLGMKAMVLNTFETELKKRQGTQS